MVLVILISLFLASPVSTIIWLHSPLPQLVQFPWRFLALTTFAVAVWLTQLPQKFGLVLAVLVVVLSLPYLKVERTLHPESYYTTNDDTTTVKNEYNSKWLNTNLTNKPDQEVVWLSPTRVRVNKMYFPGLVASVDGVQTPIDYQTTGLIELSVSPGPHTVTTKFTETPIRLFADFLSILGLGISAIWLLLPHLRARKS